jgi:glycosyltransferase involved in cell wall biosynthesis
MEISTVLPIYNCRERLERHLLGVTKWLDLVSEVIVVDSGSADGSLELAQEVLKPYNARFIHNPPGLYQSWNAGVAAGSKKWLYFSTVEDPITAQGLSHLLDVITTHDTDVVISPPEMRNQDGTQLLSSTMPSNELAKRFQEAGLQDRVLSRAESIILLCGMLPHGILGSSASNLYRTSFLKQHPFPTDFGHIGDTAWGISVSTKVKIAFTAVQCAKFLTQTRHSGTDPDSQKNLHQKLSQLAVETLRESLLKDPEITTLAGWMKFSNDIASHQWEWIAELNKYNQDLLQEIKKMEENVVNLKKAIIAINELQQRIKYLEIEIQKTKEENIGYQGVNGAIKCIKRSFQNSQQPN